MNETKLMKLYIFFFQKTQTPSSIDTSDMYCFRKNKAATDNLDL